MITTAIPAKALDTFTLELPKGDTAFLRTIARKMGWTLRSNSIFLPAAGRRGDSSFSRQGSGGYYWSSSLLSGNPSYAWDLYFNSSNAGMSNDYRFCGYTVRAVTE